MDITVTNGKRFNEYEALTAVASDNDVVLARLADGTGVKQLCMLVLKAYINGDLTTLSTDDKTSLISAINEVYSLNQTLEKSMDTLKEATVAILENSNPAALHRAIFRGKNLGSAYTDDQSAAVKAGTFDDIWLGDYWPIADVNYRVSDPDYYLHTGDTECTTHHVLVVPDTNLYSAQMNASNTTAGGYSGSAMHESNLETAKTTVQTAFGSSHILTVRRLFTNAVSSGKPSGGAWFDSLCDLMTEGMVYGSPKFEPACDGSTVPYLYTTDFKQLSLFRFAPEYINIARAWYWLQNVVSSASFADCAGYGYAGYSSASASLGVRPAFAIS